MLATLSKVSSRFMQAIIPSTRMAASSAAWPSTAPWGDYWYSSVGLPNASGIIGGDEAYEFVSTCFAATNFLCAIGGTIPLNLTKTEKQKSGGTTWNVVDDDPRQLLMNDEANADQHSAAARSMLCAWQINRGTGFAEIQREAKRSLNGDPGKPIALWPIYPTRCKPFHKDNDLWWHVRNQNGTESEIADIDMFRVPAMLMSRDGLTGVGVSDRAFQQIQLGQSLDRTENDASMSGVPRIVVEAPQRMDMPEQDAFRRQWRELHQQGGDGVALLVGGMKATPISWSATASDFANRKLRHQMVIAGLYGVPPLLLQLVDDPTADPAKLLQMFQKCGLKWLNMWVQEANRKLLTKEERLKGYGWKVDYNSLLEADPSGRADYYSRLFPLGTFSPNDILAAEGKNPYPEGNKRYVQGAMRPIDEPYNANAPQNPKVDPTTGKADPLKTPFAVSDERESQLRSAAELMLQDCVRRLLSKESREAVKASRKPNEWLTWIEAFYADHAAWAAAELAKPLEACAAFGLTRGASRMASDMLQESKHALVNVADGPRETFAGRVEALVSEWPSTRVAEICLREWMCHGKGGPPGPCPTGRRKKRTRRAKPQKPSVKAQRAKASHKLVDAKIQRYSEEHNEPRLAKKLGGKSEPDNKPYDVMLSKAGVPTHGIELKTMVSNKSNKLTMKGSAQDRKAQWEVENNATFHTVVYDDQKVYNAKGDGEHGSESARQIYYRRGGGSFRVDGMHKVKDHAELKRLIHMDDSALPREAQSTPQWKSRQQTARGVK